MSMKNWFQSFTDPEGWQQKPTKKATDKTSDGPGSLAPNRSSTKFHKNDRLLRAAEEGDVQKVKRLVALGADRNWVDDKVWMFFGDGVSYPQKMVLQGYFPLAAAAKFGHEDVCSYLLTTGIDINRTDNVSLRMRMVKLYMLRVLTPVCLPQYKWTALHYACYYKNFSVGQLLIEKGIDVDAKSSVSTWLTTSCYLLIDYTVHRITRQPLNYCRQRPTCLA
jgi:ankyrin repeat protein